MFLAYSQNYKKFELYCIAKNMKSTKLLYFWKFKFLRVH